MKPENEKEIRDITQSRKSENKVELGNQKKNSAEVFENKEVVQQYRNNGDDADSDKKVANPGHEEETFPADANLFGQGRTHLTKEKPGWHDPR